MTEGERLLIGITDFVVSLPGVLREFASNPVYALFIGALISVLIWQRQTRLNYEVQSQREKRELFRALVSQVEKTTGPRRDLNWADWHLNPDIRRLWSLQSEVELVAGQKVIDASAGVVVAVNEFWMSEVLTVISSDGKTRTLFENVTFASRRLLDAMKEELASKT